MGGAMGFRIRGAVIERADFVRGVFSVLIFSESYSLVFIFIRGLLKVVKGGNAIFKIFFNAS
jgi:hypothetical protein